MAPMSSEEGCRWMDAYLGGERTLWLASLVVDRRKQGGLVVAGRLCRMRRATPGIIKLATVPTFLFCPLLLIGPQDSTSGDRL